MTTFSGKTALLIGAGQNIGRRVDQEWARRGSRVAVADIDQAGAEETAEILRKAGAESIGLHCNVTDDASVQTLIAEVMSAAGRIDLLVNNAGYALSGAAEESSIGQVQALFGSMPAVLPHAQAGRLRAIAVGTAQRSPALPNVPTVAESGYPGFEVSLWLGFFAPKGTPKPILTRLQKELTDIASNPEMKAQFEKNGASAVTNTPAEMNTLMKTELEKYGKVVKAAGISLK